MATVKTRKDHAVHDMGGRPIKHVPLAELPENLRDRYRDRRGVELYEDLTTSELDEVVISEIKRDLLLREADLMGSKWFDYRILHPWQATALFLEAYRSEHAWVMRKREDVNSHWFHKGIKATSLCRTTPTQMTALWKARQAADSIGVPYDYYCRTLLDWAEQRNWTHLPRVSQLYLEDHIQVVLVAWQDSLRTRLRIATEPCYHREAGDEWHQVEYRRFLLDQVETKTHREFALASLIHRYEHLTEELATQRFGQAVVEKALRVAKELYGAS